MCKKLYTSERVSNPQTALETRAIAIGTVASFKVLVQPSTCIFFAGKNALTEESRLAPGFDTLSKHLAF